MAAATMKQGSFLDTMKTVLWGAMGIRRKADHERARVKPAQVIVIAVIFVVIFVLTLRFIVSVVVN